MARKGKSSFRRNKIEPSVLTLNFTLADVAGVSQHYLDLSQVCSILNRRFYRQGLNWAVSGFKVFTQPGFLGSVGVAKLPNTWVMANAWEKGMRAWMRMNKDALEESESVRPRFLDFKVFANQSHAVKGHALNLMPQSSIAGPAGLYTAGEWEMSKYIIPDSTLGATGGVHDREIIATGASYQAPGASGLHNVSLIEGYAASRGLPDRS